MCYADEKRRDGERRGRELDVLWLQKKERKDKGVSERRKERKKDEGTRSE